MAHTMEQEPGDGTPAAQDRAGAVRVVLVMDGGLVQEVYVSGDADVIVSVADFEARDNPDEEDQLHRQVDAYLDEYGLTETGYLSFVPDDDAPVGAMAPKMGSGS